MPKYELVFTSVVTAIVEADSFEDARQIGMEYDTSDLDWTSNVDFESAEEVED